MKTIFEKSLILSLAIVLMAIHQSFSQPPEIEWYRTFGGDSSDYAYSVQQTNDGGFVYCGETESWGMGGEDAFLVKTNNLGYIDWYHLYGGTENDNARAMQQTIDGGYILIGRTRSFGAGSADMYLIKTNSQGDTLWTRTYGGTYVDVAYSGQQTSDGGYVLAGYTRPMSGDLRHVYIVKTDSVGDTLWTRAYEGSHDIDIRSVQQTDDEGYILAGDIRTGGSIRPDYYLARTNSLGDTLWTRTYGGEDGDWGYSVQQTMDGGFIIAGSSESFGAGNYDMYVVKTDSSGNEIWSRTYGGTNSEDATSIKKTLDGGYIIAGGTSSFGVDYLDLYLVKINQEGDTLWTLTYGGPDSEYAYSIDLTADSGYIVAGVTTSEFPADCWLVKTGPDTSSTHAPSIQWVSHPKDFILHPAYPNPFNPTTTISFDLPFQSHINLNIYNILGQRVGVLMDGTMPQGIHRIQWDGSDLPSGIYFVRMSARTPTGDAGEYVKMRKVVLLR